MNPKISRLLSYTVYSAALFVSCQLFWLYGHPELMSYHEQYQLFLFTGDYFFDRMAVVGGLADYVSEFIVQFYYVPWAGAAMIALVMTLLQILLAACCFKGGVRDDLKVCVYALSAVPSVLLLNFMGDVNLLMSYPVAILLTLTGVYLTMLLDVKSAVLRVLVLTVGFIVLYWCVGPVSLLYPLLVVILSKGFGYRWIWALVSFATACGVIFVINRLFFAQYPESQMYYGINYFRTTNIHPASIFVTAGVILLVAIIVKASERVKGSVPTPFGWAGMGIVALFAIIFVPKGYDPDIMEVLRYDMLVRNEKWHDIISLAERKTPSSEFCLQGLNLALAKTGQMSDRMFEFDQHGISGLISKYHNDNTSCLISAEIFYHLGMINSAFRYNFDTQEAIMNDRKSGRFMKRMAECLIINHKYKAASKYINKLKKSLFYSDWAKKAEAYYADGDRTDLVPTWAEKRRLRYKQEMLYDYDEIDKMFGLLALGSDGRNLLAWDYFNAALLLKGDLQTMTGMYHYANEDFKLYAIPKHHQEAIGLFWTFGHQSFDGLPYQISEEVKRDIANLAQVYSKNMNRPDIWKNQFKGNYCVYFLGKQSAAASQQPTTTTTKGSEREG